MTLQAVSKLLGDGGAHLNDQLAKAVKELQGAKVSVVAGASNGTKMDITAMRQEDTLMSVLAFTAGVPADDTANCTIQSLKASGTITLSTGNPSNNDTVVVNGNTYTFKTTPAALNHVRIGADYSATGDTLASVINLYESRWNGMTYNTPQVLASSNGSGVVTVTSLVEGAGNGPVVTDTGSTITISSTNPAAVTATFVSAGNNDAVTINGVTFTIKTSPTDADLHMSVEVSDEAQAAELVRAVTAYETTYGTLDVLITNLLGVATITPRTARKGNIITLTESATNVAVSGSGFLTGGSNTGGFKSTTDLSTKNVVVYWFDKNQ